MTENTFTHYPDEFVNACLLEVKRQAAKDQDHHGPYNSLHEAWGVIQEELDELWTEIKRGEYRRARVESRQVVACLFRMYAMLREHECSISLPEIPREGPSFTGYAKYRFVFRRDANKLTVVDTNTNTVIFEQGEVESEDTFIERVSKELHAEHGYPQNV